MYVKQACSIGNTVQYTTYGGVGHYDEAERAAPDAVTWIQDRMTGLPAPSSC
jgi:hypothetical protein